MALDRATLISKGITDAGKKGANIDLKSQFDEIVEEISTRFDLLKHQTWVGSCVNGQNYVTLPTDYKKREIMTIAGTRITWTEPEVFRLLTATSGTPVIYTVQKQENRIYLLPTPNATSAFIFTYTRKHPKAGKVLAFTSGGTYQIKRDDVITGGTSTNTATVVDVRVTSGTWAAGTAAGDLIILSDTGPFESENLNVGGSSNVATIAGPANSADTFLHLYQESFDLVIQSGLAWQARKKAGEQDWKVYQEKFEAELQQAATEAMKVFT